MVSFYALIISELSSSGDSSAMLGTKRNSIKFGFMSYSFLKTKNNQFTFRDANCALIEFLKLSASVDLEAARLFTLISSMTRTQLIKFKSGTQSYYKIPIKIHS